MKRGAPSAGTECAVIINNNILKRVGWFFNIGLCAHFGGNTKDVSVHW